MDHSCTAPFIGNCSQCYLSVCSRDSCESAEREILFCVGPNGRVGCGISLCSSCCPSAECPSCGSDMIP
jgi:hypothetical protein